MIECKLCEEKFEPRNSYHKFCSRMCKLAYDKAKERERTKAIQEEWKNLDEDKKTALMEKARKKIMREIEQA